MFTKKFLTFYCLIIVPVLLQYQQSDAIKCYVCGDTNNFLDRTDDKKQVPPVSCTTLNDQWNNSNVLEKYIIECPKEYNGCITQIQGDQVTRACDFFSLDDCQIANNVKYCYCSFDLCNGETDLLFASSNINQVVHKLTSSTTSKINYKELEDDEDYNIKGSGDGSNDYNESEDVQNEIVTITDSKINTNSKNTVKLIQTTKIQSTIINNVPEIKTTTITTSLIKNKTENEVNLNNEILIDEDTTTEFNRKYISTTIKNNIEIYKKNNCSSFNYSKFLLILITILYHNCYT